jgi:ElaB/YqjD/DUF883 family membrane-anchored ribosome-binding protein
MVQDGRIGEPGAAAAPTSGASPDLRRDMESIKCDMAALRADLSALVNSAIQAGKVQAGDARERISSAARSRLGQAETAWQDVSGRGQEVLRQAQVRIADKPLQAVGIAFGAGLLLGAIARRR